jgi:ubiquinone/menaquinone biosynthesis C-methylase UbiE
MKTSWESSSTWYNKIVGKEGHYYHENVIFPKLLNLLKLSKKDRLLDLACGQGVLARILPQDIEYLGVDLSASLIQQAKKKSGHSFLVGDVTKPINAATFTHVCVVLALQNIEHPLPVLKNAFKHLEVGGQLVIVLNHPCFRIARQSSWGIDEPKKLQYRRIDRYLSPLKIPIQTHPGEKQSAETWTFHHPLTSYMKWLSEAGFVTDLIEEWISDKKSEGAAARMENRSREEFPLFMAISSKKLKRD